MEEVEAPATGSYTTPQAGDTRATTNLLAAATAITIVTALSLTAKKLATRHPQD